MLIDLQFSANIGEQITSHVAASVVRYKNSLYMFGGLLNGLATSALYRVRFTPDLCELHMDTRCNIPGCSCATFNTGPLNNQTVCFGVDRDLPVR